MSDPDGSGNDTIYGNVNPNAVGDLGGDTLYGGSGTDSLFGQDGADNIYGGYGADMLTGGDGNDNFHFSSALDRGDTIADFGSGSEKINLSAIDANSANGAATNEVFAWGVTAATMDGMWYML